MRVALLGVLCVGPSLWGPVAAQSPLERWSQANRHAVAQLRDPKKRFAQRRAFAETLALLGRLSGSRAIVAAPHDPKHLAVAIVSNRRLYRFMQAEGAPVKTWWERALDWVGERWSRIVRLLFGRAEVPGRISTAIADVFLAACILIFAVMLARILWLFGRRARPVSRARPISPPADASLLVAQSLAAAQRGAYAAAVAHLFAAGVLLLKLRTQLEEQSSETVGELRQQVFVRNPRFTQPFEQLALALTRAIYAERPLNAEDWAQSLAAYRQLEALL